MPRKIRELRAEAKREGFRLLPKRGNGSHTIWKYVRTHGDTYEEAAHHGKELLAVLVAQAQEDGKPLPEPRVFASAAV